MKTSTRYALLLLLISGLLGTLANQYRPIAPVISWVGASFGLMGILYLRPGKPFVGKTEFGALTPAWQLVLWPYLLMTRGLWMLQINSSSEPCCQLLAPKLWLGRRPKADEIPEEDFTQLDDSLRTLKGDILVILLLNPPAKDHWIIKRWFDLLPSGTKDFYIPQ